MRALLGKIVNLPLVLIRPLCCWVVWSLMKIWQSPQILADKTPQFLSDAECGPKAGDTYCIFAMTGSWGIGRDALRLFEILREIGVNTIVVVNGKLNDEDMGKIRERVYRILTRKNLGRDFGAYRAATLLLYAEQTPLERLIYLNDSVYYFDLPELRVMLYKLKAGCGFDVVAATENHEFSHHCSSYALSFSGRVAHSRRIRKFWTAYRPYSIRYHAINAGEMRLTRMLKKSHPSIDVIYSLERLAEKLHTLSFPEITDSFQYLPNISAVEAFETELYAHVPTLVSSIKKLVRSNAIVAKNKPPAPVCPDGAGVGAPGYRLIDLDQTAATLESSIAVMKSYLIHKLILLFSAGSQIHSGFGYLRKYLSLPFVKKDLFFRNTYFEDRLPVVLAEIPAEERTWVMRLLLNRGRSSRITDLWFRVCLYLKLV